MKKKKERNSPDRGNEPVRQMQRRAEPPAQPHYRFAFRFGVICIVLFGAMHLAPDALLKPLNEQTASVLARTLQDLRLPAAADGELVRGGGFGVRIIPECTFLLSGLLFFSFVVSYPSPGSLRIAGLLLGLTSLYALNHLRLVFVYLAGTYQRQFFEFIHVYLGEIFMVIAVFLTCLAWVGVVSGNVKVRRLLFFLLRFTAISIPLFWLWLRINRDYIGFIDGFLTGIFALFDYTLMFQRNFTIYYQTFNIVTILALIAASDRLCWRVKVRGMVTGIAIAIFLHAMFRLLNVFLSAFGFSGLFPFSALITTIGQYLFPLVLLLWLRSRAVNVDHGAAIQAKRCDVCESG